MDNNFIQPKPFIPPGKNFYHNDLYEDGNKILVKPTINRNHQRPKSTSSIRRNSKSYNTPPATSRYSFEVGATVEANYHGNGTWFVGKIIRENTDRTYDIDYNDGDKERNISSNLIRLYDSTIASIDDEYKADSKNQNEEKSQNKEKKNVDPPLPLYEVGAKVECNYRGKGSWYAGAINRIHQQDLTYDIDYDDGAKEINVPELLVRNLKHKSKKNVDPALPLYEVGAKVECNYRGKGSWYSGAINHVYQHDLTYDIDYDDGAKEINVPELLVRLLVRSYPAHNPPPNHHSTTSQSNLNHVVSPIMYPSQDLPPKKQHQHMITNKNATRESKSSESGTRNTINTTTNNSNNHSNNTQTPSSTRPASSTGTPCMQRSQARTSNATFVGYDYTNMPKFKDIYSIDYDNDAYFMTPYAEAKLYPSGSTHTHHHHRTNTTDNASNSEMKATHVRKLFVIESKPKQDVKNPRCKSFTGLIMKKDEVEPKEKYESIPEVEMKIQVDPTILEKSAKEPIIREETIAKIYSTDKKSPPDVVQVASQLGPDPLPAVKTMPEIFTFSPPEEKLIMNREFDIPESVDRPPTIDVQFIYCGICILLADVKNKIKQSLRALEEMETLHMNAYSLANDELNFEAKQKSLFLTGSVELEHKKIHELCTDYHMHKYTCPYSKQRIDEQKTIDDIHIELRKIGKCVVGFDWLRNNDNNGWICADGSHHVSDTILEKRGFFYQTIYI